MPPGLPACFRRPNDRQFGEPVSRPPLLSVETVILTDVSIPGSTVRGESAENGQRRSDGSAMAPGRGQYTVDSAIDVVSRKMPICVEECHWAFARFTDEIVVRYVVTSR